jgi:hypothetical protein
MWMNNKFVYQVGNNKKVILWCTANRISTCRCCLSFAASNETVFCRSQLPHGVRRRSVAARLVGLWVRIPPGARTFFSCACCVLSGSGLCFGLIARPSECGVSDYFLESSVMRMPWPTRGCCAMVNVWKCLLIAYCVYRFYVYDKLYLQ